MNHAEFANQLQAERAREYVRNASKPKMTLAFRCVDVAPGSRELQAMSDMVDRGRAINFKTFARHVDWKPIAEQMGYAVKPGEKGLRLQDDFAVRFCSSTLDGERVYYMVHSAIEFVFKDQDTSKTLKPANAWR